MTTENSVRVRVSEIEDAISANSMTAAQVFTQMRQLLAAPAPAGSTVPEQGAGLPFCDPATHDGWKIDPEFLRRLSGRVSAGDGDCSMETVELVLLALVQEPLALARQQSRVVDDELIAKARQLHTHLGFQQQVDEDGTMIGVSRQAVEEVRELLAAMEGAA